MEESGLNETNPELNNRMDKLINCVCSLRKKTLESQVLIPMYQRGEIDATAEADLMHQVESLN